MIADVNRQWRVARYPDRQESISSGHFEWHEVAVPEIGDGEFLVRTLCLAPGPAQRGYIDPGDDIFVDTLPLGAVMRGRGIGRVVESRHPDYPEGTCFLGSLGWQDYSVQRPRGKEFVFSTKAVATPLRPTSLHLGILGQAGATAYFGLLENGRLQPGDNVLVSAAAGGVGSVAGQIARIRGARAVTGITGSDEKAAWLRDSLGFDHTINYRTDDLDAKLQEYFPQGIDVFFDAVGGDVLNIGLKHLAMHARVVICGFISTNYSPRPVPGPANYRYLLHRRAWMSGFVVFDHWDRFDAAEAELTKWYRSGELVNTEDVDTGLENMPGALDSLFSGANRGIKICRVAPD